MNIDLFGFLEMDEAAIGDTVFNQIRQSNAAHYQSTGEELLAARCERLVREFFASLRDAPGGFSGYICKIAEERITEGFQLEEIQTALSIFEQEVWRRSAQYIESRGDLLQVLSAVSWTIGDAKDELARAYLRKVKTAEADAADLKNRMDVLFKGTDSGAMAVEEF